MCYWEVIWRSATYTEHNVWTISLLKQILQLKTYAHSHKCCLLSKQIKMHHVFVDFVVFIRLFVPIFTQFQFTSTCTNDTAVAVTPNVKIHSHTSHCTRSQTTHSYQRVIQQQLVYYALRTRAAETCLCVLSLVKLVYVGSLRSAGYLNASDVFCCTWWNVMRWIWMDTICTKSQWKSGW